MRSHWVVLCLLVGVLTARDAFATHDGRSETYKLVGFTPDSRHVYFEKETSAEYETETWLVVYDTASGKRVWSEAVARVCPEDGLDVSPTFGEHVCHDERRKPVPAKVGDKIRKRIYAKYGAPTATVALAHVADKSKRQVLAAGDVRVEATLAQLGKLADPMAARNPHKLRATFDLAVDVTADEARYAGKARVWTGVVEDPMNGNITLWPAFTIESAQLAPDRKTLAIVFANKPFVVKLAPVAATTPAR